MDYFHLGLNMNHKSEWWWLLFIAMVVPTALSGDDFCPAEGCESSPHKEEKATVLLIGSTGNGKSALGNFLLNPFDEEILYDHEKQYFKTSTSLQPQTKETKVIWKNVAYESFHHLKNLTVIDTPGLNDVKDSKNMIYLMKKLQDLEGIHTCIVVVKFNGKIDNQYKETLKYYFKLLPDLFKRNLVVVVTHYSQDAASITTRNKLKINEEVIKRDILDAVCTTCGLSADPMLFMIDCVPAQEDNVSLSVRNEILDYVFNQEPTIPQFKVAKLPSQLKDDKTMYDKLLQEATEQSRQMYSNNPTLQKELEVMENAIADLKADRKQWKMKKDDLDTEELVDGASWDTKEDWELFEPIVSDTYYVETCPYKIQKVIKKGSDERWKGEQKTPCSLSGKVEARREFHGFRASITLQVYKRDYFEKEITNYKKKIEEIESHLKEKEMEHMKLIETRKEKSDQLIEEARQKNKKYLDEYMTVDEAIEQLAEGYQEHGTPFYDNQAEEDLVLPKRPKSKVLEDAEYEEFCKEVEVIIHVANSNEYNAAVTFMDAPDVEGDKGEGRATIYPMPTVTNVLGMFGKDKVHLRKTALVRTQQGSDGEDGVREAIKKYPNARCLLGVGVCYSFWKQKHLFADVLVSSAIDRMGTIRFTKEGIKNRGAAAVTHENLNIAFCTEDKFKWGNFQVSNEGRLSRYFVGTILSYDALFKDAKKREEFFAGGRFDNTIGGEMEGTVLANMEHKFHIPVIIVKGVVDYGDNDKGDIFQFTAAMAAFDYTATSLENVAL